MQKYRLVYQTEIAEQEIMLQDVDGNVSSTVNLCVIDKFTSFFAREEDCIESLVNRQIISSSDGSLHIKRPNGKQDAQCLIFNDKTLRKVSISFMQQAKRTTSTRLQSTSEFDSCVSDIILFFISNEGAIDLINSKKITFNDKNDIFAENLATYFQYQNKDFYENWEIGKRNSARAKVCGVLRNYEFLRNVRVWMQTYNKEVVHPGKISRWKNPYEEYENRLEASIEKRKVM